MTVLHQFRGTRYTMTELAQMSSVPVNTLRHRVYYGWTLERAMTTPTPKMRRRGVVMNFAPFEGTGAGGTAQEIPNISFSDEAQR